MKNDIVLLEFITVAKCGEEAISHAEMWFLYFFSENILWISKNVPIFHGTTPMFNDADFPNGTEFENRF